MRENFRKAYLERLDDKKCLEGASRRLATMHVGGVVIECMVKAMRVESDRIAEWHIPSETCSHCRTEIKAGKPQPHGVKNPGHNLMLAIQHWPRLWNRLTSMNRSQRDTFIHCISLLENPSVHFIDLRYEYDIPNDDEFGQWCEAFKRFHAWLCQQDQRLKQGRH
jgi:hypothetical protein